ncbi:MAG: hypothetical protein ACE5DO_04385 [Desulfobacterales bacterium]
MAEEIRLLYTSDRLKAADIIKGFLENRLNALSLDNRLALLEKLSAQFSADPQNFTDNNANIDRELLSRLFRLLLGRNLPQADLSSEELLERLTESITTIFDALNKIVNAINTALLGKHTGEETIRHVIGFHLEGENRLKSLENYLGQIKNAFLMTQQAFTRSAKAIVGEILFELDPDQIETDPVGGLKFHPRRKTKYYDIYKTKFNQCHKWFESERFMEALLREFERNCVKLSASLESPSE